MITDTDGERVVLHWGTVSPEESCQYKLVPDGYRQGLMDLQLQLSHQTTGPAKLASQDESKEKQRDLGSFYSSKPCSYDFYYILDRLCS